MHPPDQPQPDAAHWDSEHEAHTGFDSLGLCLPHLDPNRPSLTT